MVDQEIRIVRSERRARTVSIRQKDGYLEVLAPATSTDVELQPIIARLRRRLEGRRVKRDLSDDDLQKRAEALNQKHFASTLRWTSIGWVSNQDHRWGSCTPAHGTIRISHRLAEFPPFVLDYVLVHELAHLVEPSHNRRFWRLVKRYPFAERARGYLLAVAGDRHEEDM
jgi:predicted metal-dependent hydrolase